MSSNEQDDLLILDIDRINALAPYLVSYDEDRRAFVFAADNGVNCSIFFIPDGGAFRDIKKIYNIVVATKPAPIKADSGIQHTISAILSVFFDDNNRVAAYFCDHRNPFDDRHTTHHPYQTLRSRLFNIWYMQANKERMYEKVRCGSESRRGGQSYLDHSLSRLPGTKKVAQAVR